VTLIGDTLRVLRLPLHVNQRRVTRAHITDLVDAGGHYGTNIGDTLCLTHVSYLMLPVAILVAGYILKLARI
jgi:uncharacterized protein YwlG (UPF0340 family)